LRYFNVAGATDSFREAHHPETQLIPRVLEVALGQRRHLNIYRTDYKTRDGTCVRDYIDARDLAEVHVLAVEKTRAGCANEVVSCAERIAERQIPCVESPRRAGDAPGLGASHEKIRAKLGWRPNLSLAPLNVWRSYNQRARAKLIIRELKDACALGKIPMKDFQANEAFFQIVLLAYNLLNWFKRLCAPAHRQRATLQRLRQRLFVVPSQLVWPGGVATLRIAPSYPYFADFLETLRRRFKSRELVARTRDL
jgi:hypothetical protein